MNIQPIKTKDDHDAALRRIEELIDAKNELIDAKNELEVLAVLIGEYERREFPTKHMTPIEAIKFRLKQRGLTYKDLAPYIGNRLVVTGVMSGRIPLNLRMIRDLHAGLGIPAEVLIREEKKP